MSKRKHKRSIYWISYIRKGMEVPEDRDVQNLVEARKVAKKLYRRGYQGEICKVREWNDPAGWFTERVKQVWTF